MSEEIVKRGYLYQQSISRSCFRKKRNWTRIFVLLKDGCLFLYAAPAELQPLHQYSLYASAVVFPTHPKVTRSNCLEVETPTSSLFLCADSPSDMKEWALAIQKAAIVASGGSLGKWGGASAAAQPGTGVGSPQLAERNRLQSNAAPNGNSSTSSERNGVPTLQLPFAVGGSAVPASSLVGEATAAALYDRVLSRFRNGSTVTAFTSNSLASLAPAYARSRNKARRRIAEEWQADGKRRKERNQHRAEAAAQSLAASGFPSAHVPFSFDVPSLGTLRLSSTTVRLGDSSSGGIVVSSSALSPRTANNAALAATSARPFAPGLSAHPDAEISVTNTASYPVAIRVGDKDTETWLRTNTPLFLAPGAACIITFERVPLHLRLAPSATAAAAAAAATATTAATIATVTSPGGTVGNLQGSPAAASSPLTAVGSASAASASSSSALAPEPPRLPCAVLLRARPCDPTEMEQGKPTLMFETEDGQPTHRVGETVPLNVVEREIKRN